MIYYPADGEYCTLVIPGIDATGTDGIQAPGVLIPRLSQELQRKVAERYFVYPVCSLCASEEFLFAKSGTKTLSHKNFSVRENGSIDDVVLIKQLFANLWMIIESAWDPGTLVMWREFPYPVECDMGIGILLRARLGSFE